MAKRSRRLPEGGKTLTHLIPSQSILLDNETCAYCHNPLTEKTWTKEHVIGRNFVPKGKFNNRWNLILGACSKCNGHKAILENDLSAVTLQPDASGKFAQDDPELRAEAERKGKGSKSSRTDKAVEESRESLTANLSFGPSINASVRFVAPPQAEPERVFELAQLQLSGFCYWLSYKPDSRIGFRWSGSYMPLMYSSRGDWGNVTQKAFMSAVVNWPPRVLGETADSFFKIAIRKHPSADSWSWALEWNHQYRIIGFLGERVTAEALVAGFPALQTFSVAEGPNVSLRIRAEHPLGESEDTLFYYDETTKREE
jgi:hypothetical protein